MLSEPPRAGFDLDRAISKRLRALDLARQRLEKPPKKNRKKKYRKGVIVAEGDSWFRHPGLSTIPDWITKWGNFYMRNNAGWGYTLEKILANRKLKGNEDAEGYEGEEGYLTVLRREEPVYFLLSAGGNDLLALLASKNLLSGDGSLTEDGKEALKAIECRYRRLLSEVTKKFPDLKVLTYGYDYLRPCVGEGTYIGQHLNNLKIPQKNWFGSMKDVLDEFNKSIEAVVNEFKRENVRYLNCRGVTKGDEWHDDMHPSSKGFKALADEFEKEMIRWRKEGKS